MKNILYLLIIISLISCDNSSPQIIENVGVSSFQELIMKKEGIIIDVRTPQEFYSGHLKDATNIDFYADDFIDKLNIIRKDMPIYVYCRSGGRSSLAAGKMEELEFRKIYNLIDGIQSWDSKNFPTIKSKFEKKIATPTFTDLEFDIILKNHELVLVDFSTQWCVPCKKMKPVIQEIKKENINIKVLFIDPDVNNELVKRYQIKGIPVFIVFKNAKEVFRYVGIISKEELLKKIY